MSQRSIVRYHILDDRTVGQGGFLTIRRLRLRLERDDGTQTGEGLYDYVERPIGLDAVVLAIYSRVGARIEVLVREGLRVPFHFGRGAPPDRPRRFTELVAGILETGEEGPDAIRRRAAAEALEEAGVTVAPDRVRLLGAPTFPTPGMCPELFHLAAVEITPAERAAAVAPPGDGSPFEEGARLTWLELDDAIGRCLAGAISDLKTEVALRRLKESP